MSSQLQFVAMNSAAGTSTELQGKGGLAVRALPSDFTPQAAIGPWASFDQKPSKLLTQRSWNNHINVGANGLHLAWKIMASIKFYHCFFPFWVI